MSRSASNRCPRRSAATRAPKAPWSPSWWCRRPGVCGSPRTTGCGRTSATRMTGDRRHRGEPWPVRPGGPDRLGRAGRERSGAGFGGRTRVDARADKPGATSCLVLAGDLSRFPGGTRSAEPYRPGTPALAVSRHSDLRAARGSLHGESAFGPARIGPSAGAILAGAKGLFRRKRSRPADIGRKPGARLARYEEKPGAGGGVCRPARFGAGWDGAGHRPPPRL
jgi:hypothetical protein